MKLESSEFVTKSEKGADGKVPIGIYERNGTVSVEVVKNVTAESLLKLHEA